MQSSNPPNAESATPTTPPPLPTDQGQPTNTSTTNPETERSEKPPNTADPPAASTQIAPGPSFPPLEIRPLPQVTPRPPLKIDKFLGKLDLRTPEEDALFLECEAIVRDGWAHFARVGQALMRIQAKELYKNEYGGFEDYCCKRWGFKHSKAWGYMAAAQVHQTLAQIPGIPLPECEAQVRPLIGLSPELSQQAWLEALGGSRDGYVPARLVKRAVRQLIKTKQPQTVAQATADRQERCRRRQLIRTGFKELLTMLVGNTERKVMIAKVQEIERLLEPILKPKKKQV
jgi:hypothetical protein